MLLTLTLFASLDFGERRGGGRRDLAGRDTDLTLRVHAYGRSGTPLTDAEDVFLQLYFDDCPDRGWWPAGRCLGRVAHCYLVRRRRFMMH